MDKAAKPPITVISIRCFLYTLYLLNSRISSIPEDTICPLCGAPHHFIYDNNGGNGQYQCKVCGQTFISGEVASAPVRFICPHCGKTLVAKKDRKFFRIHKCVNPKCPYYLHNLKKIEKKDLKEDYGKNKYKLHYIYREFTVDFFTMDLNSLPRNASSLKFSKHNAHVMSLCLTLHINLKRFGKIPFQTHLYDYR